MAKSCVTAPFKPFFLLEYYSKQMTIFTDTSSQTKAQGKTKAAFRLHVYPKIPS